MNPAYKVISEPLTRWLKVSTEEDVSWFVAFRQLCVRGVCIGYNRVSETWRQPVGHVLQRSQPLGVHVSGTVALSL